MAWSWSGRLLLALLALLTVLLVTSVGQRLASALFNSAIQVAETAQTARIFSGERITPAFAVSDASGGSPTDVSSPFAADADGRQLTTSIWSSSFAPDRYVDLDFNAPLPAGLSSVSASVRLSWASATVGATACYYVDVRSRTGGTLLATYGSVVAPLACVTGTTAAITTTAVPIVSTSDRANDLEIRIYGRSTGNAGTLIDSATVVGTTGMASFSLYPIKAVDVADTTRWTVGWGPAGT